jgi:hypothetical protein
MSKVDKKNNPEPLNSEPVNAYEKSLISYSTIMLQDAHKSKNI